MKTIITVLFTSMLVLASAAQGQSYQTLTGYLDTLTIPAGQTALVVSVSSDVVLEVKGSKDNYGQQFRFRDEHRDDCQWQFSSRSQRRNLLPTPSTQNPIPIAGPIKLTLRTSGMVTIVLSEQRSRPTSITSQSSVRRFAAR